MKYLFIFHVIKLDFSREQWKNLTLGHLLGEVFMLNTTVHFSREQWKNLTLGHLLGEVFMLNTTVEFRILKPPKETKIGSRNRGSLRNQEKQNCAEFNRGMGTICAFINYRGAREIVVLTHPQPSLILRNERESTGGN